MPRERKHCQLSMKVSIESLPVRASDRRFRTAVGSFATLVGIIFMVVAGLIAVFDPTGEFVFAAMLMGPIGLGMCISGLYHFMHDASLTITSEAVTFAVRDWSGRQQWSEPLANYKGVLLESEMRMGARQKHLVWNILLEHADEGRRILLRRESSEDKARQFQERCCRLLKLAALEPTAEGVARREPEDLAVPVQFLPPEQDGQEGPDAAASAPAGLRVLATPREAEITLLARMPLSAAAVAIAIVGILWAMVASGIRARPFLALAVLASMGACGVVPEWLWGVISRPRLHITDEVVELIRGLPLGQWRVKRLECDEIVAVIITKRADQVHEAVVLRGPRKQIRFGRWLKLDELKWLKNFILDRLAQSSPAAAGPSD